MLSQEYIEWIAQGYQVMIWLTFLSCLLATVLAILLCGLRLSNIKLLVWFARFYIAVFRNTPLLVQLFFWYNGVSRYVPFAVKDFLMDSHEWAFGPITLSFPGYDFIWGFVGLSLYSAAYIAEELRAGVQTVGENQRLAALALGFSPVQAFFSVVLPQAVRNAMSTLVGQYMMALKNSSLTASIGVAELLYVAAQIETRSLLAFQVYVILTFLYIATIAAMELVLYLWQRRQAKKLGLRVLA